MLTNRNGTHEIPYFVGVQLVGGLEKILGVGLNFKIGICPAHPRLGVGLEKLRTLCEAYAKSIKRGKFTSGHQSLVDAYAQHQLSTKKHR